MLALLVLLAVLAAAPVRAQSCACAAMPAPCAGYWGATTVFTGRLDRVTRDGAGNRRATFTLLDRYRGISSSDVVVTTGPAGHRCSLTLRPGREYIVYARPDGTGALTTNVCLRTREIDDAAADLAYVRALKEGSAPPGRISGQVLVIPRDLAGKVKGVGTPAAGMTVTIAKDGATQTTVTDRAGDFVFEPREPGRYTVGVDASDRYYVEEPSTTVELRDPRACAHIDRHISSNGRIAGRVVDASGKPVSGLTIDVTSAAAWTNPSGVDVASRRSITDSAGQYQFQKLPAGRFVVGINIGGLRGASSASLPRVFHPGVTHVTRATTAMLPDGGHVALADLKLSPSVRYVSLSGVVIDPNGQPADNARVFLKGAGEDDTILAEPVTTDDAGRFVIAAPANLGYRLFAERTRSDGQIRRVDSTDQIAVVATAGHAPVRLLLRQRY